MKTHRSWRSRAVTAEEAVARIPKGARVFVHGAAATPTPLLEALCEVPAVEDVTLYHLHLDGPTRFADEPHCRRIYSVSMFTGGGLREPVAHGTADFMPVFLSEVPSLFESGRVDLDAALIQLSPPDAHGLCSLGTSVDAARAAVKHARVVIAEINERMPRTHGRSFVPFERLEAFVHTDRPLPEHAPPAETSVVASIGNQVARLVEDGATLQLGIGAIPNAVLSRLGHLNELGIHTETFSDGVIPLVEKGVITNARKKVFPGRLVTSFVSGTRRLYDFVDDNPLIEFLPCDRTNDTAVIRKNERVTAINSAIEIDLTGQVCADSIGHRIYSGIGGQMDFIRGAALSEGGKAIIALPSTARGGSASRIVTTLRPGAGVVTTRGHVQWVVTEYGAVNLRGLPLRERAIALIGIAHPDVRAELAREVAGVRHFTMSR